jgi:hypothetical protein
MPGFSAGSSPHQSNMRECVVRVANGTGFFVAPGLILTCAHVVKGLDPNDIKVLWKRKPLKASLVPGSTGHGVDCAILKTEPVQARPLLLDPTCRAGDIVEACGYTIKLRRVRLEAFRGSVEGPSEDEDGSMSIKLQFTQLVPGNSGSPLINTTTGAVCGMLRTTRDESQALGGYAVPIEAIVQVLERCTEARFPSNQWDRSAWMMECIHRVGELDRIEHRTTISNVLREPTPPITLVLIDGEIGQGHDDLLKLFERGVGAGWASLVIPWPCTAASIEVRCCSLLAELGNALGHRAPAQGGIVEFGGHALTALRKTRQKVWLHHKLGDLRHNDVELLRRYWEEVWSKVRQKVIVTFEVERPASGLKNFLDCLVQRWIASRLAGQAKAWEDESERLVATLPELRSVEAGHVETWLRDVARLKRKEAEVDASAIIRLTSGRYKSTTLALEELIKRKTNEISHGF